MDFAGTTVDDVRALVVDVPRQARAQLQAHDDEAWRIPGADGSWSAAEYLCHLRDIATRLDTGA